MLTTRGYICDDAYPAFATVCDISEWLRRIELPKQSHYSNRDRVSPGGRGGNYNTVVMFLGLDCSTQQLKAVVIDDRLRIRHEASVGFDNDLPHYETRKGVHVDGKQVLSP